MAPYHTKCMGPHTKMYGPHTKMYGRHTKMYGGVGSALVPTSVSDRPKYGVLGDRALVATRLLNMRLEIQNEVFWSDPDGTIRTTPPSTFYP